MSETGREAFRRRASRVDYLWKHWNHSGCLQYMNDQSVREAYDAVKGGNRNYLKGWMAIGKIERKVRRKK